MSNPARLTKADARRALVRHHFAQSPTPIEVFRRLKSIQFDPIAPAGGNADLVLQARVPTYKIGDWEQLAYQDRLIYDGWDKQASLVPFEGWPLRRYYYTLPRPGLHQRIFVDHKEAVDAILKDLTDRGPLQPKDCEFQLKKQEWKSHWHTGNVTKQVLRALWHTGQVMTAGRKKGQHLYDLTERIVPPELFNQPKLSDEDSTRDLVLDRHTAMGMIRPVAPTEVWSQVALNPTKRRSIAALLDRQQIVPIEVEGVKANATPDLLTLLDQPSLDPRVVFVAPLDPFMWDRKMTAHLFDFDYVWEIYVPEPKRRWGYYVLPILFGDRLVARIELWARNSILEVRQFQLESPAPDPTFWPAFEKALQDFMAYSSTTQVAVKDHIDPKPRDFFLHINTTS